jgi:membrane-associated phospholipid phosphatase
MKARRHVFLLSLLLTFPFSLRAQNRYNFSQFGDETWSFVKQPGNWEGSDWLKLGLIGAGTFLAMETVDQPVRDAVLRNQKYYYKSVPIEGGRIWGETYMPIVLFGGFALHSLVTDDGGTKKIAYEIAQASLYAAAITYTMKFAFGRARPYTNEGATRFQPFTLTDDGFHSLSSGHATVAFALSTVLSRNAHSGFLKVLAYVPAVFTVVSRVYQDQHWVSDNLLGAAVGYFVATWVVDIHEHEESRIGVSSIYPLTIRITVH